MATEAELLASIEANMDEDAPRLAHADWLEQNGDPERAEWHDQSLWFVRAKRDAATDLPEWEALREAGAALKAHAMGSLAELLEAFEARATAAGITVHWARRRKRLCPTQTGRPK